MTYVELFDLETNDVCSWLEINKAKYKRGVCYIGKYM